MTRLVPLDRERVKKPGPARSARLSWRRLGELTREQWVALVLVVGAVGFTGTGLARLAHRGDTGVVTLPLALLGADLLIAVALVTRWYPVRPVAQGLAIFGALVHVLVLLKSGPWWIRGWSGVLTVAHLSALVLFFSLSAREYEQDDEDASPDAAQHPSAAPSIAHDETDREAGARSSRSSARTAPPIPEEPAARPPRAGPAARDPLDEPDTGEPDRDGPTDQTGGPAHSVERSAEQPVGPAPFGPKRPEQAGRAPGPVAEPDTTGGSGVEPADAHAVEPADAHAVEEAVGGAVEEAEAQGCAPRVAEADTPDAGEEPAGESRTRGRAEERPGEPGRPETARPKSDESGTGERAQDRDEGPTTNSVEQARGVAAGVEAPGATADTEEPR